MDADVIVVGGGHNGLICAAYLARAGVDTLLVEARDQVGGCASTVSDLGARFNICNCDHSMIRGMPVIDELDLARHGLRYVEPEISSVFRFHDGAAPWVLLHDTEAHLDALAQTYPSQLAGYRRYLGDAMPVAELIMAMASSRPRVREMSKVVAGRRARGAARLLRWSRMSMSDVMGEYFDDWHVTMPAVSTGPSVWGVAATVPGTGTAGALYAMRHLTKTGRPVGGSGALTDATLSSFQSAGGQLRSGNAVDQLLVRDGAIRGVRLDDGTQLTATRVVSACDPRRVFVDWLDQVPPAARRLVRDYRARPAHDGYESKLDAVLLGRPTYSDRSIVEALVPGGDDLSPTTVISPDPTELAEAHRLRNEGRVAPQPTFLVNVPSVLDPTLQPTPSEHVLSIETLFTPYALQGGWSGSTEPDRWLELVSGFFEPGSLQVDRFRAMTPDRYEREFGMHRGHAPAYSGPPLRAFLGRDRELTRYRTPIDGLYLCGAGTFPGAGIFGASGRNAATEVLDDRG